MIAAKAPAARWARRSRGGAGGRVSVGGAGFQEALDGEEGHLGVVGDQAGSAAPGRDISGDPLCPVLPADRPQRLKLDRRSERVADRAAQEATSDPIQNIHAWDLATSLAG